MEKQLEPIDPNITIEEEWETWWNRVKPDDYDISFEISVRNAFYAGVGNMGFIMTQLAKEPTTKAGNIADRLFMEVRQYFEESMKKIENGIS